MNRPRLYLTLLLSVSLLLVVVGCDPKLTGPDDETPGTGGDETPASVAPEARTVAGVVTMHADILSAALTVSAAYDSASAGAPIPRFLTDGCISVALEDALANIHTISLDSCSDPFGTTYSGGGELIPLQAEDGYYFEPVFDSVGTLTASNAGASEYQHWYSSGTLQLVFNREDNAIISVGVENFLRHDVGEDVVTFSYDGVVYGGASGAHDNWPAAGGVVRVGWDSVGIFDVTFTGGAGCTYTIGGTDYACDLETGTVTLAQQ